MDELRSPEGATRSRKILGRGRGTGRGKTSGKGHKGQNARAGGGVRVGFEGGQMPLYRRIARRGFSNYPFKKQYVVVSVGQISKLYENGETVDLETLTEKNLIKKSETLVKILSDGEIDKKVTVKGVKVSRAAAEKIVSAGGSVDESDNQQVEGNGVESDS
jgi:large subunit ribosomal protein L15